MNNTEKYNEAKRNTTKKLGFYLHLAAYVLENALLVIINLTTSPGYIWFIWPMLGWGIGIFVHGMTVFLSTGRIKDKMIQRELEMLKKE